jgi:broad specificity phosphatase PhoE
MVLTTKMYCEYKKYFEIKPDIHEAKSNCENFLEKIKNDYGKKHKQILVVTHGGIIGLIQKIVCNIDVENTILFSQKKFESTKELFGNCAILCVCLNLSDGNYRMISPANTYHLDI